MNGVPRIHKIPECMHKVLGLYEKANILPINVIL